MEITNNIQFFETPTDDVYMLYNYNNNKTVAIGKEEKRWIESLSGKQFFINDVYNVVGSKYYKEFIITMRQLKLLDANKTKEKLDVFKLKFYLNIDLKFLSKINNNMVDVYRFIIFVLSPIYLMYNVIFKNFLFEVTNNLNEILGNFNLNTIILWCFFFFVSGSIHELSHDIIAKRYNVNVPRVGIMLLYFNPAFFVELSGIEFIKNFNQKLEIMLSGIGSNLLLSTISILLCEITPYKSFFSLCLLINIAVSIMNIVPLADFDGGILFRDYLKNFDYESKIFKFYFLLKTFFICLKKNSWKMRKKSLPCYNLGGKIFFSLL